MKIETEFGLLLQAQVVNKDGKIKSDTGKIKAKCFTRNMAATWATILVDRIAYPYVVNTVNFNDAVVTKNLWNNQTYMINIKYPDDDTIGIVVGRDDTMPERWDNVYLGDFIIGGAGSGELSYGTMNYSDNPRPVSGGIEWTIYREFINNSGSTIIVKEIGLLSKLYSGRSALVARDVLPNSQSVSDGDTLRIAYTFRAGIGYTLQFLQLIADIWTFRSKATPIKQIDGDSVAVSSTGSWSGSYYPMSFRYGFLTYDDDRDGIILGGGDTAETLTDYALDAMISSGTGPGELVYGFQRYYTVSNVETQFKPTSDGYMNIIFERLFENRTASDITVREVGLAVNYVSTTAGNQALILRKVLDTPVTIQPGGCQTILVYLKFPQG